MQIYLLHSILKKQELRILLKTAQLQTCREENLGCLATDS